MRDLEDEKRIKAYMAAKMAHIKMYNECMNLADGLDVEKFAELVRADEREACAKVCEGYDVFGHGTRERFAKAIRARSEKPPVKSYCGGKPNYCTPKETLILDRGCWERGCVAYDGRDGDGVNISAERVDETAKRNCDNCESLRRAAWDRINELEAKLEERKWVGLTDEEMRALKQKSVDDGMTRLVTDFEYIRSIEAKLKDKNCG